MSDCKFVTKETSHKILLQTLLHLMKAQITLNFFNWPFIRRLAHQ